MLAKIVNDNAGCLVHSGAHSFFASKLVPTKNGHYGCFNRALRIRLHESASGPLCTGKPGQCRPGRHRCISP
ncbi:hypothetical protein C7A10_06270 [Pseudomonas fluorescens]|uniref:Uncharacterized protein n=1 Tax=Pseudomonas fluorescens TaxID=294 RepID=A0A2T0IGD7_PSEFL|nr:hypothetical protein C7A10_06270 [Pseudomonas fluorescens]